jgi:hypothetical protein
VTYVPFNFTAKTASLGMGNLVLGCTFVSAILTGAIFVATNKVMNTFVYKIEFDPVTNQLVVTQPSKSLISFGKPVETKLEMPEFKMLAKDQLEALKTKAIYADCLYFNGKTGQMYATVGRGLWYN